LTTLCALFELPTALLEYFDIDRGAAAPLPLGCYVYDFDMIEIKYSCTALLLLLVNPCIPHKNNRTACPTYIFIIWKEDASLPAMNPLCSSTNQQLFKRTFAFIKVATMKFTDDFCYEWKLSHAYHKINTFRGEQRWMGHKGRYW